MAGRAKVKIDGDLLGRAREAAETAGYSSVEEFLDHILSRELGKVEQARADATDAEDLRKRLKGLGYIS